MDSNPSTSSDSASVMAMFLERRSTVFASFTLKGSSHKDQKAEVGECRLPSYM